MKAPGVTSLEGVSTYALWGIRVRGVKNPQGFSIDERRFDAGDSIALIRLYILRAVRHAKAQSQHRLRGGEGSGGTHESGRHV
ncbi:Uncharacterised protein [uncultured archaeon]|nr:Uncharacterised protein [uncultured archaeon]